MAKDRKSAPMKEQFRVLLNHELSIRKVALAVWGGQRVRKFGNESPARAAAAVSLATAPERRSAIDWSRAVSEIPTSTDLLRVRQPAESVRLVR